MDELHLAILNLYDEGCIAHLHSGLKETIRNALSSLVELFLLDSRSYLNQNGSKVVYLSAPIARKETINEYFTNLVVNMPHASEHIIEKWGDQVLEAIKQANIVLMSARL